MEMVVLSTLTLARVRSGYEGVVNKVLDGNQTEYSLVFSFVNSIFTWKFTPFSSSTSYKHFPGMLAVAFLTNPFKNPPPPH